MNTGFGATGDTGATISGFGNTGTDVSGFFNTASGGATLNGGRALETRPDGSPVNGEIAGFFNTGAPSGLAPGLSGEVSGLLNTGSVISGLFSLANLFK